MSPAGQHRSGSFLDLAALCVATGFGSGRAARAPGTWGSLAALGCWWIASLLVHEPLQNTLSIALLVTSLLAGWWSIPRALRCGRFQGSDPGGVVIDEWAGMFTSLLGVPVFSPWPLVAFGLFRLLDILKPGPIGWAERVPGATGVLLDDLVAGALVGILMHGLLLVW